MRGLLEAGISPNIFQKGHQLLCLEIYYTNVRFLNAFNYLKCQLDDLKLQFNITAEDYFFPKR